MWITMIDIAAMIRKAGVAVKSNGRSKDAVAGVYCSECGGMIRSDDVDGIGYIRTRRGIDIFFHEGCRRKIGTG